MQFLKRILYCFAALTPMAIASNALAAHPAVIELFTSQGCSSCPPADKLVGTFADSPDILVLSFHVDYWNYLGWKDPYSSAEFTARQRDYARFLGSSNVYTPQAVVQGSYDVVGSYADRLKAAINKAKATDNWVNVTLKKTGNSLSISLPSAKSEQSNILLIGFDKTSTNAVPRGENAGEKLTHRNSVTEIKNLGTWQGESLNKNAEIPKGDGTAVLIQSSKTGAILGAAWL